MLPDGHGGCCRVDAEVLKLLTQRTTTAKLTDLRSNGKGACCLNGYDCPGGGPDVCGNKGPLCGFDRAYLSAFQSSMNSMNDQTAMKEAIKLAHQLK